MRWRDLAATVTPQPESLRTARGPHWPSRRLTEWLHRAKGHFGAVILNTRRSARAELLEIARAIRFTSIAASLASSKYGSPGQRSRRSALPPVFAHGI